MKKILRTTLLALVCVTIAAALISPSVTSTALAGSRATDQTNLPKHEGVDSVIGADGQGLSAGSFSTFFTFRGNGIFPTLRFLHPSINGNSRVFVSISEFTTDASTTRFIGSARLAVYTVAPFNGGFFAWVEIPFGIPLNVRFDVLVDP